MDSEIYEFLREIADSGGKVFVTFPDDPGAVLVEVTPMPHFVLMEDEVEPEEADPVPVDEPAEVTDRQVDEVRLLQEIDPEALRAALHKVVVGMRKLRAPYVEVPEEDDEEEELLDDE